MECSIILNIPNELVQKLAKDMAEGKDLDLSEIQKQVIDSRNLDHLDDKYGEKKIYILTLMVCTRMSEKDFVKLTDDFAKKIPSKDWSKNVMQCIPDKIDWSIGENKFG